MSPLILPRPRTPAGFCTRCCTSFLVLDPAHFPIWHFFIRKTGHFVGYFTLSWLLFRAWRDTFPFPGNRWSIQWARISFFMTALVACLDEWHQSFLPSRTGNLHDVLLDSTAALIAQVVLFLVLRRGEPTVQSAAQNLLTGRMQFNFLCELSGLILASFVAYDF